MYSTCILLIIYSVHRSVFANCLSNYYGCHAANNRFIMN